MGLSKPIRFRKAVLGLTAIETDARELKVEDVVGQMEFIISIRIRTIRHSKNW